MTDEAATDAAAEEADTASLTEREVLVVEEKAPPSTPVIYEIVRRQGEEEMARPLASLWWSGVAAGLSISFSVLSQAAIYTALPAGSSRELISSLGYPVGFLIVVLSRQQLFTENTITVVLPVMKKFTIGNLWRLARLWSVVFAANMVGTWLAALFWEFSPALTPQLHDAMLEVSRHLMGNSWSAMFAKGVPAGFLIAAMVWAVPSADAAKFHIVALLTYVISAGGFTHIVAGSVEAFMLVMSGDLTPTEMLLDFSLPMLAGNIVGGTALFALISHAQVMNEI